ncbi:hypothetical protein D3C71_1367860 [compost metagenome]
MRAVDGAQLQGFKRRGLGHEARTARAPVRAAGRELIFHHPFQIRLTLHRPGIVHAQRSRHIAPVLIGRARHDAVHH